MDIISVSSFWWVNLLVHEPRKSPWYCGGTQERQAEGQIKEAPTIRGIYDSQSERHGCVLENGHFNIPPEVSLAEADPRQPYNFYLSICLPWQADLEPGKRDKTCVQHLHVVGGQHTVSPT